jgi:chromosome segregation ATPase
MSDDQILAALARLEAGQTDFSGRMDRLEAGQTDLSDRMDRMAGGQTDLSERMDRMAAGQTDLSDRMDRMEAGQGALRADLTRFRADLMEEHVGTRTVLVERMDRLQTRIDQLHEECFTAFAQGETVRRHSDGTRAEARELVEQISGLVRQMRMLRSRIDNIEGP